MTPFEKLIGGALEASQHYPEGNIHVHHREVPEDHEHPEVYIWDPDGKLDRAVMERFGWQLDADTSDWFLEVGGECG